MRYLFGASLVNPAGRGEGASCGDARVAASAIIAVIMSETSMCKHVRTRLIAKDKDAEYVECLDCGALLEAGEVRDAQQREARQSDDPGFGESLSDA